MTRVAPNGKSKIPGRRPPAGPTGESVPAGPPGRLSRGGRYRAPGRVTLTSHRHGRQGHVSSTARRPGHPTSRQRSPEQRLPRHPKTTPAVRPQWQDADSEQVRMRWTFFVLHSAGI